MLNKRRLFDPVAGDGSLLDDLPSGSDSPSSAYSPSYSSGAGQQLRPTSSPQAKQQLPLPPLVNPFLNIRRTPSDMLHPREDVDDILDRMMDSELEAVKQQLRGSESVHDDRFDDDGYDEYGNRRPGAMDPMAINDEYSARIVRALRGGAITDPLEEGGQGGTEALAARPVRGPGRPGSSGRSSTGAAMGTSRLTPVAASSDDYDVLSELLEFIGGELEEQGPEDGELLDEDMGGEAGSPKVLGGNRKRPLTTTELMRQSQVPVAGPSRPQLLGRPTTAGAGAVARDSTSSAPLSSSPMKDRNATGRGSAFAASDAELLEELLGSESLVHWRE